jgi:hypothetical protein
MGLFGLGDLALHGLSGGVAGGLAVAGAAALTTLYLLRLRRRQVAVPFAALWVPTAASRPSGGRHGAGCRWPCSSSVRAHPLAAAGPRPRRRRPRRAAQ